MPKPKKQKRYTASTLLEFIRTAPLLHELLFLFPPPSRPSPLLRDSDSTPTPLAVASPRIPRTAPRGSHHGAALAGGDRYLHQHHRRRRGRRCPQARGETDLLPSITPSVLSTVISLLPSKSCQGLRAWGIGPFRVELGFALPYPVGSDGDVMG